MGTCIYFVSGVSATFDPIKTYDYTGNADTLVSRLHRLAQDKKLFSIKLTDTTGIKKTGFNYYFELRWINPEADTIEYSIKLSRTDHWFTKNKTVLELVEAINLTHLSGGYSQTAQGIQPLINNFDINIIPALMPNKH